MGRDEEREAGHKAAGGPAGSAGGEGARPRSLDERSESGGRGPAGFAGGEGARPLLIDQIVEIGRRTRKPPPRWLWIVAIIVGACGAGGFAAAMLATPEPVTARTTVRSADGSGMGSGLLIGAAVGIVIGYAIARQRADHSSRSRP